jgi:hypothetical protein
MKTTLIAGIVLLAAACTYLLIKANKADPLPVAGQRIIYDSVYALHLDAATFNTLPDNQNVVLSFLFDLNGKLTLRGWLKNLKSVDADPDFSDRSLFTLAIIPNQSIEMNSETVFNNIVLNGTEIEKIKIAIKQYSSTCVQFTPSYILNTNSIKYDISVEKDCNSGSPATNKVAEMNPSPPKQYN